MGDLDEFRESIGAGAMKAMDEVDEEYIEVLCEWYNATLRVAGVLLSKGIAGCDVCSRLAGLAADAAHTRATSQ